MQRLEIGDARYEMSNSFALTPPPRIIDLALNFIAALMVFSVKTSKIICLRHTVRSLCSPHNINYAQLSFEALKKFKEILST